ncbi:MAG: GvpL/GvpF family gas vesicle protein [Cyanobacteria bacterium P01_H01_bin.162]
MIYVYALCPTPGESLSLPQGIAQPVQLLVAEGLGAIAEPEVDVAQVREDDAQLMEAVLAHDRVLGQLFAQMPLLPLRFGTQFKDRSSLQTFLHSHQQTYLQRLQTLQDRAEYLLKLSPQPYAAPAVDETVRGREYFLAKKRRLQEQTAALAQQQGELQSFLTTLTAAHIPFVQSAPQEEEERLHILLSRDALTAQTLLAEWQRQLPTWQLVCSEPLPPYHFAT